MILVVRSLSQKNIMTHLKVNIAHLRKEKEHLNLDQELKYRITYVLKLISLILLQAHAYAVQLAAAYEDLKESTTLYCSEIIYSS